MKKSIFRMTGLVAIAVAFCILYITCNDNGASSGKPDDRAKDFVRKFNRPTTGSGKDSSNVGGGKDSVIDVPPSHVHDWGNWIVTTAATCNAPGVETRTCKTDNTHKETRAIAQLTGTECEPNVVDPNTVVKGTITDSRDSQTYKTVKIGNQTWMAENLNYQPLSGNSWCYGNDDSNCNKYGRLYDWSTALTVCPTGWHLPSRQEWEALVTAAGGKETAGNALKSTSGWNDYNGSSGNGTDNFGFSALPGGLYQGYFINAIYGYWWTATGSNGSNAYCRVMKNRSDDVLDDIIGKSAGYSVRCVQ